MVLVACPSVAVGVWEYEVALWTGRRSHTLDTRKSVPELGVVNIVPYSIATWPAVKRKLRKLAIDVLIIDEGHFLKDPDSQRSSAFLSRHGLCQNSDKIWVLTGTPAKNHPGELWAIMQYVFGEPKMSQFDFMSRYTRGYDRKHGFKVTGAKNAGELSRYLDKYMLRRTLDDVEIQLPPLRFADLPLTGASLRMPKEVREQEASVADALMAAIQQGDLTTFEELGVYLSTARRLTGEAKVKAVIDTVSYELDNGEVDKIILFAVHRGVIGALQEGLARFGVEVVAGGQSAAKKTAACRRFNTSANCRVFIGQIEAAGTAITLNAAAHAIFVEASWVPADNAQASKRCHRIGQTRPVLVRFATLPGSLDSMVMAALRRKTEMLAKVIKSTKARARMSSKREEIAAKIADLLLELVDVSVQEGVTSDISGEAAKETVRKSKTKPKADEGVPPVSVETGDEKAEAAPEVEPPTDEDKERIKAQFKSARAALIELNRKHGTDAAVAMLKEYGATSMDNVPIEAYEEFEGACREATAKAKV